MALLAPAASASVSLDADDPFTATLDDEARVTVQVPFHLTRQGGMYAKLLSLSIHAENPFEDRPGTVEDDHSAGIQGWWAEFRLLDDAGDPLTTDADGRALDAFLGAYADDTPTPVTPLPADVAHRLEVTLHVPEEDRQGGLFEIPIVLVFRDPEAGSGEGAGASLEQSTGATIRLQAPAGEGGDSADTSTTGSGSGENTSSSVERSGSTGQGASTTTSGTSTGPTTTAQGPTGTTTADPTSGGTITVRDPVTPLTMSVLGILFVFVAGQFIVTQRLARRLERSLEVQEELLRRLDERDASTERDAQAARTAQSGDDDVGSGDDADEHGA